MAGPGNQSAVLGTLVHITRNRYIAMLTWCFLPNNNVIQDTLRGSCGPFASSSCTQRPHQRFSVSFPPHIKNITYSISKEQVDAPCHLSRIRCDACARTNERLDHDQRTDKPPGRPFNRTETQLDLNSDLTIHLIRRPVLEVAVCFFLFLFLEWSLPSCGARWCTATGSTASRRANRLG
jgi:hypothetical protein